MEVIKAIINLFQAIWKFEKSRLTMYQFQLLIITGVMLHGTVVMGLHAHQVAIVAKDAGKSYVHELSKNMPIIGALIK